MNANSSRIFLAVLCAAVFLFLLAPSIQAPLLYSPESDAATPYHLNPDAFREPPVGGGEAVLPLMSDLLDQTGAVTIRIREKDFEYAEEELAEFLEQSESLDRLVVRLDLQDTDIEEFRQRNRENLACLATLLNDSQRFEELRHLEIQYRDGNRPDLLVSVAYEGEAIRDAIAGAYEAYSDHEENITAITSHYQLDPTPYTESVEDFAMVLDEVEGVQAGRQATLPAIPATGGGPAAEVTIEVTPDEGAFGDVLTVRGIASPPPLHGEPLEIYIDGREWSSPAPNSNGFYSAPFVVARIGEGSHYCYAIYQSSFSKVRTFTILGSDSAVTLDAAAEDGAVLCNGNVTGAGIGVGHAPVALLIFSRGHIGDGSSLKETVTTTADGEYTARFDLPPDEYTVIAAFSGDGFPLRPSESMPVKLMVTRSPLTAVAAAIAVVGGASAGGWWYIRRISRRQAAPLPEATDAWVMNEPDTVKRDIPPLPTMDEPIEACMQLYDTGQTDEAVAVLFDRLRKEIGAAQGLTSPEALTSGELLLLCIGESFSLALETFLRIYEPVRYGGRPLEREQCREIAGIAAGIMMEVRGR